MPEDTPPDRPHDALEAAAIARRNDGWARETRVLPEEAAIALVFNGSTQAVMMGTPTDLADLSRGFALSEGLIGGPGEIERLAVSEHPLGWEVNAWLTPGPAERLTERRRLQTGPTGCGLCGVESLEAARAAPPAVTTTATFSADQIAEAAGSLRQVQALNARTRAVHAAALWLPEGGPVEAREDVGRHNALDKLIGACAASRAHDAGAGVLLLSSRVSVEMVTKAARLGAGVLVAVSAPTALAVRTAQDAGLTLVAIARGEEFEAFTHPHRVRGAPKL